MMHPVDDAPDRVQTVPGAPIVGAALVGAGVITAAGVLGAVSEALAQPLVVPVSAAAALIGVVGFVWSYLRAVSRSRVDEISVTQLYMVAGTVAPPSVKRRLQWSLWLQTLVAIVVMSVGFARTDPEEFNWAACIIVAPLYGMGINGVWVATHGSFGARIQIAAAPRRRRRSEPRATSGEPSRADAPRSRSTTRTRTPHPLAQGRPPRPQRSAGGPRGGADDRAPAESRTPPSGMEQNDQHG